MNKQLMDFIEKSPTAFQAASNIKDILVQNGYIELEEYQSWNLEKNQKYFVIRNESSVIAFTTPNTFETIQITASHLDSPTFKLKDNGEIVQEHYTKLNVEKYGGMIASTWFDRPLSLAGRLLVEQDGKLQSKLFSIDEDLVMIPNVAIHMDRNVNEGHKYDIQKELLPIIGQEENVKVTDYIKQVCHIQGNIMGHDIFLYNRQKGTIWGANKEFISMPRIDNLMCAFGTLQGLLHSKNDKSLNMCLMFDNEEVGSGTKQGADSTFLTDVLTRIKEAFSLSEEDYQTMVAKGFMISADNAHAYHPNYGHFYDVSNHPFMNQGIVIKHNANQKYTSDAMSAALFRMICKNAGVPYQDFHNHSNVLGGSTLGNISNTQFSLNTVDIGLAQLAMHSSYETAGSKDLEYLVMAMIYFYNHTAIIKNNCVVID